MKPICTNCKKPLGKISLFPHDGREMCLDCGCKIMEEPMDHIVDANKMVDDFPHRHFPRIRGYVVTDNPEGFEDEIKLMLAEQRRLALEEAIDLVCDFRGKTEYKNWAYHTTCEIIDKLMDLKKI